MRNCVSRSVPWLLSAGVLTAVLGGAPPVHAQAGARLQIGLPAPDWTLNDSAGRTHRLQDYRGKPLLVVGSDQPDHADGDLWQQRAAQRYGPALSAVAVADLRRVPGLFRGFVRSKITHNALPAGGPHVPLLLDWHGTLCGPYLFKSGTPRIVLIDSQGIVRYAGYGPCTDQSLRALTSAIDAPLKGGNVR